MYVTPKEAQKTFNVSRDTLRRWAIEGKIKYITTQGGHRRYLIQQENKPKNKKQKIIYARVSSKKQEQDLKRQIQFLKSKYPKHRVIKDIGSGINFKRRGFKTLLELVFKDNVEEVVVYSKDRLAKFGQELIEDIFQYHNTKLIIASDIKQNDQEKTKEQELAEDIISIVTVFSARYHGKRKYKKNN